MVGAAYPLLASRAHTRCIQRAYSLSTEHIAWISFDPPRHSSRRIVLLDSSCRAERH